MKRIFAALLVLCSSCSWIFVDGPPARATWTARQADCTSSSVAPAIDATLTAVATALMVWTVVGEANCNGELCGIGYLIIGAPALVSFVVFGASALSGFGDTSGCKAAHHAYRDAHRDPTAPPPEAAPGVTGDRCVDGSCDTGLTCKDGHCVAPGEGEPCSGPCQSGFLCRGRRCSKL